MQMLHFTREEFDRRISAAGKRMGEENLDGIVLFRQESMYYLTGYDTSGYTMFQALYRQCRWRARVAYPHRGQYPVTRSPPSSRMCGSGMTGKTPPPAMTFVACWRTTAAAVNVSASNTTPMG